MIRRHGPLFGVLKVWNSIFFLFIYLFIYFFFFWGGGGGVGKEGSTKCTILGVIIPFLCFKSLF